MKNLKHVFKVIVFIFLAASCSSGPDIKGKTAAEVLFKEAQNFVERERYLSAIEKLNTLKSQHPYSFYATPAELLLADIRFLQEDYVEAAASYLAFRDLHPKHKSMDYIIFKIADSYFHQMPSTNDRDLTAAHQSMNYFSELLKLYPQSKYRKDVDEKIQKASAMIEGKEKYIADFYFKTEKYQAARYRYLDIISNFKNPELLSHAKMRVVQSSFYMGEYKECLDYLKQYAPGFSEEKIEEGKGWADSCGNKIKEELKASLGREG